uniref:Mitochondrial ATP synthase regulatory component factor B n=1 Tax=Parascaris equorum TaxID=6256 RepID=A0A914RJM7_PAREQ
LKIPIDSFIFPIFPKANFCVPNSLDRQSRASFFTTIHAYRFIPERLLFLGPDLAAAHFLVHRRRVPDLFIEAIDASDTELMFEGFDNLCELEHLRMLRLAGCRYADDWMMGRIGTMFSQSLEMLDLKRYMMLKLKNFDLAKTALLLEESIPGLKVLGLNYDLALESLKRESKLLENDRVLIDAKGNAYAEDDNGRLFYIAGKVNERPAVCDEDKPLM